MRSFALIAFAIFRRSAEVRVSSGRFRTVVFAFDPDKLKSAREDIKEVLKSCHPLTVFFSAFFLRFCLCAKYIEFDLAFSLSGIEVV